MFVNNLDPVAFEFLSFQIRWYSLAYIFGFLIGWFYIKNFLTKDLSEEIVNIIRSERDEIVLRMKISTKEETEVLKKRIEKLENEIKTLNSKKKIKKVKRS